MQGRKTALIVRMDDGQREQLLSWLRATKTPVGLAKRAWAMPLLDDGTSYAATSRQVGLREGHLRKWAKRFLRDGPEGLHDAARAETGSRPILPGRNEVTGRNRVTTHSAVALGQGKRVG